MHGDESTWHVLMDRLADLAVASIRSQLDAGAAAFQLFDSWAGTLARRDYERFVAPHSTKVFGELRTSHPHAAGIHFGIGCDHLLEAMHATGPTVVGLDWRTPIRDARRRLGAGVVVQGNLDPSLVLAGREVALAGVDDVLADNDGHPGHVFNLGHGVQPGTDPGVLTEIVAVVHDRTAG
jgi:uroporphyrinogen decarboxylase